MLNFLTDLVPARLQRFISARLGRADKKRGKKRGGYPPLPAQAEAEFAQLLELFRREKVRRYLEIGSRYGGSFNAVMRSLPPGSFGLAVDLPGVSWGRSSSETTLRRVVSDLRKVGYGAALLLGNSQDAAIVEAVAKHAPFDAVFIDGDHSYAGVRADWLNFGPLARIVAFHDITGDGATATGRTPTPIEVPLLWREIRSSGNVVVHEFVADTQHSPLPRSLGPCGIGVAITETAAPRPSS
jgi:hypothetical protein